MKYYNSLITERDAKIRELHQQIMRAQGVNRQYIRREVVIDMLAHEPAPRFYISPEWAMRYITAYYGGQSVWIRTRGKERQAMIRDLVTNFERLQRENPDKTRQWLYMTVVEQPAQSFYVSKQRIKEIIFNYTGRVKR